MEFHRRVQSREIASIKMKLFWDNYRRYLIHEFEQRRQKNPRYSMRAYARDIEMTSSRLSEILNGKVGLSPERAHSIGSRLRIEEEVLNHFVDLVASEHSRSEVTRNMASQRVQARLDSLKEVTEDQYKTIAEWYHFALLEYLKLPQVSQDPEVISKAFGLSAETVRSALERLARMGFIETHEGRWISSSNYKTTNNVPSQAVRQANHQVMEKAQRALETKPVQEREISAVIFKYRKADTPKIKERIRSFRRELMSEYEAAPDADAVSCLATQFFQLDGE